MLLTNRVLATCLLGAVSIVTAAVAGPWYEHELDGSVTPDKATPAWQSPWRKLAESRSEDGLYRMTVPAEDGGHVWIVSEPGWKAEGRDSTVEFRVHIVDSDEAGLRLSISNKRRNWVLYLVNGTNADQVRVRTPQREDDPLIPVPDDFFTVRVCIRHGQGMDHASVYVNDAPQPVAQEWTGFASAPEDRLMIGDGSSAESETGTLVWDHIRWTNAACVPPAAPKPPTPADHEGAQLPAISTFAPRPDLPGTALPAVAEPPRIDGKLDDSCWQQAVALPLHAWRRGKQTPVPAEAKVCADADELFVAVRCSGRRADLSVPERAGRDNYLGGSETVELFLDPDLDRSSYYQVAINISNTLFDCFRNEVTWNASIRHATAVTDDGWVCELALRKDSLDRTARGPVWGLNLNVIQATTGALLTWAPVKVGHHEPWNFGYAAMPHGQGLGGLQARAGEARETLAAVRRSLQGSSMAERHSERLDRFAHAATQISARAGQAGEEASPEKLLVLWRDVEGLLADIRTFRSHADSARGREAWRRLTSGKPYAVIPVHTLAKVTPNFLPGATSADAVDIAGCRGESESFQVVVFAGDRPMHSLRVRLPELTNGDSRLGTDAMTVWCVDYVEIRQPSKYNEIVPPGSLIADPLTPAEACTVAAGGVQAFWITVRIPRAAAPGAYGGVVELAAPGFPAESVPVRLKVWDFERPVRPRLKTSFGLWQHKGIDRMHGVAPGTPEHARIFRSYGDMLLRDYHVSYRFFPGFDPARPQVFDEWMEGQVAKGATVLSVPFSDPPADWLPAFQEHLRGKGWLDMAYARPGDEPEPKDFPDIAARVARWKAVVPDIKTMIAGSRAASGGLEGAIDAWCPLTSGYDRAWAAKRRAEGEEVWWYVCNVPYRPHANFLLDHLAIEHRILFWQTFQCGADGLLYWNTVNWRYGDPWRNAATWRGSNGDGSLFYPGARGPLPSIRLEIIRDGIEDYDLLALLRDLAADRQLAAKAPELAARARVALDLEDLCGDLSRFTRDADRLLGRRREIGDLVEVLSRLQGQ